MAGIKPWKVLKSNLDHSYRVFRVRTDHSQSPRTGREHKFFVLESCPWVNVIPLTKDKEVVLIHQYRHGIRKVTLEIPGGLVDPGRTPLEAAQKELLEETGCSASRWTDLGWVHPNPAILDNRCYTYIAHDVDYSGAQQLDDAEDIQTCLHPLSQVPSLIRNGDITHALVLAAFYRLFVEYDPVVLHE